MDKAFVGALETVASQSLMNPALVSCDDLDRRTNRIPLGLSTNKFDRNPRAIGLGLVS